MIISNESMDFNDPKELDDPQLFDDQFEVWTLIIQKSTVIPPSLIFLFKSEEVAQIAARGGKGGSRRPFEIFPKIHPIGSANLPLLRTFVIGKKYGELGYQ